MSSLWRNIPSGNIKVQNFYSKNADGVIVRNEFWGGNTPVNLTINKSTITLDNIQLSLTVTSNTPFTGTIGKGSVSLTSKQLIVSGGLSLTAGKSTRVISNKQFAVAAGFGAVTNKSTLNISYKNENISVGTIAQLQKLGYNISSKSLTNLLGFRDSVNKTTLAISSKAPIVGISFLSLLGKQSLPLASKQFSVVAASELPFLGTINKTSLSLSTKALSNVISFIGGIQKAVLNVNNKTFNIANGNNLSLVKQSNTLSTKQLVVMSGVSCTVVPTTDSITYYGWSLNSGWNNVVPVSNIVVNNKSLETISGFVGDISYSTFSLNNKQLQVLVLNGNTIIPIEQVFSLSERKYSFVIKNHKTFYTLTDN